MGPVVKTGLQKRHPDNYFELVVFLTAARRAKTRNKGWMMSPLVPIWASAPNP
jgi:hypothetical protein